MHKQLNPSTTNPISDELWEKSIGKLNTNPMEYSSGHKTRIIHLIDSVSRGYTSPMEAYQALEADYFPEYLLTRESKYAHLV